MTRYLQPGEAEPVKGAVHELARGLCVVMALYNVAAFAVRTGQPRGHLAFNALLYGCGAWYERLQIARHRSAR